MNYFAKSWDIDESEKMLNSDTTIYLKEMALLMGFGFRSMCDLRGLAKKV